MRVLVVPMSWGRGMGPIVEMLEITDALKEKGITVGFAVKDIFRQKVIKKDY